MGVYDRAMRRVLPKIAAAFTTFVVGVLIGSMQQRIWHNQLLTASPGVGSIEGSTSPRTSTEPNAPVVSSYPEYLPITPFEIESFINRHPDANLDRLWERLGISYSGLPFDMSRLECGSCSARRFDYNLDDDPVSETVLQIEQQLGDSYRYLLFKEYGFRDSKFLGHIDVWAKYRPSDPVVLLSGGRPWLIVQGTAATGSGLAAWLDTVYEVSDLGVKPVASYLSKVSNSGDPTWPTKAFAGQLISVEISGDRAVLNFSYSIEYFGFRQPLFSKRRKAVLVGSLRNGTTYLDPVRSEISRHEWASIFNLDSMSEDDFLTYNRSELIEVASGNDSKKRAWLKEFLQTCQDNHIKRELVALLQ